MKFSNKCFPIFLTIFVALLPLSVSAEKLSCYSRNKTFAQIFIDCKSKIEDPNLSKVDQARASALAGKAAKYLKKPNLEVLGYFLIAVDKGLNNANYEIGNLYYEGYGDTSKDYQKAVQYFNKITVEDISYAQVRSKFSEMYLNGYYYQKDLIKAEAYLVDSVAMSMPQSAGDYWGMSIFYENSKQKKADYARAYFWLYMAYAFETDARFKGIFFEKLELFKDKIPMDVVAKLNDHKEDCQKRRATENESYYFYYCYMKLEKMLN